MSGVPGWVSVTSAQPRLSAVVVGARPGTPTVLGPFNGRRAARARSISAESDRRPQRLSLQARTRSARRPAPSGRVLKAAIAARAYLARPQRDRFVPAARPYTATTLEHLRDIVHQHHPERGPPDPTAPPRARLAALLTPEELRELINRGDSLRAIAGHYDINRHTIHDELIARGIAIPPKNTSPGDRAQRLSIYP